MNDQRPSGPPGNENAPAQDRGARKVFPDPSKPRHQDGFNNKDYEDRRNAAACFRNKNRTEDWHPQYVGVAVVEGLRDGDKCWINVGVRQNRNGEKYLSVTIKKQRQQR